MSKKLRLVLIGGHLTPALAVLEEARARSWSVFWVGYDNELESRIVLAQNVPLFSVVSSKFQRFSLFSSIASLWRLPFGFLQSLFILLKIRPHVVCGFGSYVSVPVVAASWVLRIPVVIHEQTIVSGLANRLVSKFADKVAVTFLESRKYFPSKKVIVTGNLLRKSLFNASRIKDERLTTPPTLYISGGSRGARAINDVILEVLPKLLERLVVYHQTGQKDLPRFQKQARGLSGKSRSRYHFFPYSPPGEIEKVLSQTDFAISRAGANTVLEFALFRIPAIFIPLPFAGSNEQLKNAELLLNLGAATVVLQEDLNGKTILKATFEMLKNLPSYKKNAQQARSLIKADSAKRFVNILESVGV